MKETNELLFFLVLNLLAILERFKCYNKNEISNPN